MKHITAAWFTYLLWPASSKEASPVLLQLPYFRVLIQGRIGVTIFCFVAGYVCALKPIKLFQQGLHNKAYESMTKSAIRRVPSLVLPITITIMLSGIATQLGAFEVANHCDGYGLPVTSPNRRPDLYSAINAVAHDLVNVWTHNHSEYGSELWTMMPILKGAYWVYVLLVTTAHVQQKWRMAITLALVLFRWAANDSYFGMQFFFGVFMADLQNLEPGTFTVSKTARSGLLRGMVSIFFLVFGLYVASLPDDHFEWAPWSLNLRNFMATILPPNPDFPHFSSGLGLDLIVVGLHFNPMARTILSNRFFRWLGRMSFAVYLLHNQILRSVLCWMVYGFAIPKEGEPLLKFESPGRLFMLLPIYFTLVYTAAHFWTNYVNSWCIKVAGRLVEAIKEDPDEKPGLRLP